MERDSYDLKRPNFESLELNFNIADKPVGSPAPKEPFLILPQPSHETGEASQKQKADESSQKTDEHSFMIAYRPELFGAWENFQRLEGLFLRQTIDGKERRPFFPSRSGIYRSADIQSCCYAYDDKQYISNVELATFSRCAMWNREQELIHVKKYLLNTFKLTNSASEKERKNRYHKIINWITQKGTDFVVSMIQRSLYEIDGCKYKTDSLSLGHKSLFDELAENNESCDKLSENIILRALKKNDPIYFHFELALNISVLNAGISEVSNNNSKSLNEIFFEIIYPLLFNVFNLLSNTNNDLIDLINRAYTKTKIDPKKLNDPPMPINLRIMISPDVITLLIDYLDSQKKEDRECIPEIINDDLRQSFLYNIRDFLALIRQKSRRVYNLYFRKFTFVNVSDLQFLDYLYDRLATDMMKANFILSHLTWGFSLKGNWLHETYKKKGIEYFKHNLKALSIEKKEAEDLIRLFKLWDNKDLKKSFKPVTPLQNHFDEYQFIMKQHAAYIKYRYSDTPSASAILSVRDLKSQDNPKLISYRYVFKEDSHG
ncbi:MAG: hypothetical protein QNK37_09805 [Acidobacteriota bacterium]|nr:hypothetical protein [Acidobacteriota bacterium]